MWTWKSNTKCEECGSNITTKYGLKPLEAKEFLLTNHKRRENKPVQVWYCHRNHLDTNFYIQTDKPCPICKQEFNRRRKVTTIKQGELAEYFTKDKGEHKLLDQ